MRILEEFWGQTKVHVFKRESCCHMEFEKTDNLCFSKNFSILFVFIFLYLKNFFHCRFRSNFFSIAILKMVQKVIKFMSNTQNSNGLSWARWCLPSFNKHCDQMLKGKFADYDNCFSHVLPVKQKSKKNVVNPWENPTLLVYTDTYGF